jgi:hypothetical protein
MPTEFKKAVIGSDALKSSLADDIFEMFEDEELADFHLKTSDDEVMKAHKFILAARSPVRRV